MPALQTKAKYSSKELVNGIAQNDEEVLQFIYHNNLPAVMSFVLKNNGDESDARDLFQDTIIAVWLNVREGRFVHENGSSLAGYIFQIARNKWLDKVRSKPFKATLRLANEEFEESGTEDELTLQEERIKYLSNLYNNLGEKCKAILSRFYFKKMSLSQIAGDLEYDASTLRTMKYRCMKKLREMHLENQAMEIKSQ